MKKLLPILAVLIGLLLLFSWLKEKQFGADFEQATAPGSSPTFNRVTSLSATTTSLTVDNLLQVLGAGTSTFSGKLSIDNLLQVSGAGTSTFSGLLGLVGSSTPYLEVGIAGDVAIGGAIGTSTLSLESTSSSRGGCIELRDQDTGKWIILYPGTAGTSTAAGGGQFGVVSAGGRGLVVEYGTKRCQTGNE